MSTKMELKHLTNNPFGNIFERSKLWNFKYILFLKKPKMSLLDIFNYNKLAYQKQKEYARKNINPRDSMETGNSLLTEISFKNNENNINSKTELDEKKKEIKDNFSKIDIKNENDEKENEINNNNLDNIINIKEDNDINTNEDNNFVKKPAPAINEINNVNINENTSSKE